MNFQIMPKIGAASLRFGMQVDEVRRELGGKFKSFKRTPDSPLPCDYFTDIEVFAYYKLPGILEAIEFAAPANPLLNGQQLVGVAASDVKKILEGLDQSIEIDADGVTSHALGVGVYAPGWDEDSSQAVESVIVFEEGYY